MLTLLRSTANTTVKFTQGTIISYILLLRKQSQAWYSLAQDLKDSELQFQKVDTSYLIPEPVK